MDRRRPCREQIDRLHWDVRHNVLADGPDRVVNFLRNLLTYATTTQQPGPRN